MRYKTEISAILLGFSRRGETKQVEEKSPAKFCARLATFTHQITIFCKQTNLREYKGIKKISALNVTHFPRFYAKYQVLLKISGFTQNVFSYQLQIFSRLRCLPLNFYCKKKLRKIGKGAVEGAPLVQPEEC